MFQGGVCNERDSTAGMNSEVARLAGITAEMLQGRERERQEERYRRFQRAQARADAKASRDVEEPRGPRPAPAMDPEGCADEDLTPLAPESVAALAEEDEGHVPDWATDVEDPLSGSNRAVEDLDRLLRDSPSIPPRSPRPRPPAPGVSTGGSPSAGVSSAPPPITSRRTSVVERLGLALEPSAPSTPESMEVDPPSFGASRGSGALVSQTRSTGTGRGEGVATKESARATWPLLQVGDRMTRRGMPARSGGLFTKVKAVPVDPDLDPPPYACYNCWQRGHDRHACPQPAGEVCCFNCGRRGVTMVSCPRCCEGYWVWRAEKRAAGLLPPLPPARGHQTPPPISRAPADTGAHSEGPVVDREPTTRVSVQDRLGARSTRPESPTSSEPELSKSQRRKFRAWRLERRKEGAPFDVHEYVREKAARKVAEQQAVNRQRAAGHQVPGESVTEMKESPRPAPMGAVASDVKDHVAPTASREEATSSSGIAPATASTGSNVGPSRTSVQQWLQLLAGTRDLSPNTRRAVLWAAANRDPEQAPAGHGGPPKPQAE